jgi:hypothetical protein
MLSDFHGQYAPFFVGYQRALNELGCGVRHSGDSFYALRNAMAEYALLRERPFSEGVSGGRKHFLGGYECALRIFGEGAEKFSGSDEALRFARWAYGQFLDDPAELVWLLEMGG